ncbi:aspartate/glutamate racemase family protein [Anaerovibrio lipolyticus]|uniref:aspartate/glutamate racemase family protein n=1 Tax=Anaerovibrio lipolyticus TaxID=82374 RepID=UPI000482EB4C|nr:amino acid racemase [Anaerovibrio lipolyticus]
MNNYSIGVLGGMGTYATIKLFQQYAEIFPAEKEWERPRIIIDNNCVMPSRVRAALYGERRQELLYSMTNSMSLLLKCGVSRIILACNTSHLFLEDIYKVLPEAEDKVVNIIDACVDEIVKKNVPAVYLLASEGTILSGVYQSKLDKVGIKYSIPDEKEFFKLRLCIEAVKQNKYDENIKNLFIDFVDRGSACILGCTELPILYDMYKEEIFSDYVYNPLEIALKIMRDEYKKIMVTMACDVN